MDAISRINGGVSPQDLQRLAEETMKQNAIDVKTEVKEAVSVLQSVISGNSITVGRTQNTQAPGSVKEVTGLPEIDGYDEAAAALADLEKLLEDLTIDDERSQSAATQARIQSLLKKLEANHTAVLARLKESMDKAIEVAKAANRNKIFGWVMKAVLAIGMLAMTVLTVGSATPLAIAALSLAAASTLLTIGDTVADAAGWKDKIIDSWAEKIKKDNPEMSLTEAKAKAAGNLNLIVTCIGAALSLASIGCGIAMLAKNAAEKVTEEVAKNALQKFCSKAGVQLAAKITSVGTSAVGLGLGITTCVYAFSDTADAKELSKLRAQLKEAEALIMRIKDRLAEEEENLKQLLLQLQGSLGSLSEILGMDDDTNRKMLANMNLSI